MNRKCGNLRAQRAKKKAREKNLTGLVLAETESYASEHGGL
jgi:hypothetical protein